MLTDSFRQPNQFQGRSLPSTCKFFLEESSVSYQCGTLIHPLKCRLWTTAVKGLNADCFAVRVCVDSVVHTQQNHGVKQSVPEFSLYK